MWTIPAARMKMKRPHRVPLSPAALALVKAMPVATDAKTGTPSPYIFAGQCAAGCYRT